MEEPKTTLEVLITDWAALEPHALRDAVIVLKLGSGPTLEQAAIAIAEDHTAQVQAWVVSGAIAKPTPEQLAVWKAAPQTRFNHVILQPYVLIQELALN